MGAASFARGGVNLVSAVTSPRSCQFSRIPRKVDFFPRAGHFVARGGSMTTVWRPRVRIAVPNGDDAEGEVEVPEEVNKGAKRKCAPRTKGPCEHGVKYRSNCKVCSACPHGRRRRECKQCGGASICEHGRVRSRCKECGGSGICEHGRVRSQCKECIAAKTLVT